MQMISRFSKRYRNIYHDTLSDFATCNDVSPLSYFHSYKEQLVLNNVYRRNQYEASKFHNNASERGVLNYLLVSMYKHHSPAGSNPMSWYNSDDILVDWGEDDIVNKLRYRLRLTWLLNRKEQKAPRGKHL